MYENIRILSLTVFLYYFIIAQIYYFIYFIIIYRHSTQTIFGDLYLNINM